MLVFLRLLNYHNKQVRDTNVNNCWANQTFYTQLLKFAIMSKQALTSFPKEKINILFLENISEKAVQRKMDMPMLKRLLVHSVKMN